MFLKSKQQFNPVEEIDSLIKKAIEIRASDIHIEPSLDLIRIRVRVDGSLIKLSAMPIASRDEILAIIKVMASLDSTIKREAQDGKIHFDNQGNFIEIRVSILPFKHGEKAVLRIQNTEKVELCIDNLGINGNCMGSVKQILHSRQGLILVTGATGSGKTTTIYSMLNHIATDEINVVTIEDPIEYEVDGFIQVQLSKQLKMGYAEVLKAVLRQDPDVLVIGEIRDPETARVAIRAALTGHLVIASLHTNDAIDTIVRLREMGIEAYLIAAALKLITYQRLLRQLCPHCKEEASLAKEHELIFHLAPGNHCYKAKGCRACSSTGYLGRKPVYELLYFTEEIVEILAKSEKIGELRRHLLNHLSSTLVEEAASRIAEGDTSCDEAIAHVLN